jgi:Ras-related protein Rab-1A
MDPRPINHLLKLVLIGDTGVGKSCILMRIADNTFSDTFISTIGVDFRFRIMRIGDKNVKLQIWDTAGQERFRTITSAYYRNGDAIIIVYDVCKRESFDHVRDWLNEINRYSNDGALILLIANKSDRTDRVVSEEEGRRLARELGVSIIETSAKTADNVDAAFVRLAEQLIQKQAIVKRAKEVITKEQLAGPPAGVMRAGGRCCVTPV